MGKSKGGSEEDCVVGKVPRGSPRNLKPLGAKSRALLVGKPEPDVSARDRRRVAKPAFIGGLSLLSFEHDRDRADRDAFLSSR
jgi:hypothetical protein